MVKPKWCSGRSRGATPHRLIFRPNGGPKGRQQLFGDSSPPLPQLRVWMTGPLPYLKVWIRHCGMKAISNPFPLLCLYTKVTKIHTVLFATVWQNNYIVPLTKPKWGTHSAVLIDTFQVVNEVDTCFPPPIDYVSRRILHEGVNMVLDPAFLACCDCTDNCQVNWCHHLYSNIFWRSSNVE